MHGLQLANSGIMAACTEGVSPIPKYNFWLAHFSRSIFVEQLYTTLTQFFFFFGGGGGVGGGISGAA